MSYLSERETIEIPLPSKPGYWVKVYRDLEYREVKQLAAVEESDSTQAADQLLKAMIVDWNLDDSNGKLEINPENIDHLKGQDANAIMEEIAKSLTGENQKKSS